MALSAGLVAGKPQRGTIKFMHPNAGGQIKHLCPMRLNRHCVKMRGAIGEIARRASQHQRRNLTRTLIGGRFCNGFRMAITIKRKLTGRTRPLAHHTTDRRGVIIGLNPV